MDTFRPTLIIAGTTSGVGKTTISLAIMHALKNKKGLLVQPFKIGPDFIDPSYHKIITRKESRTLDAWFMGKDGIVSTVEGARNNSSLYQSLGFSCMNCGNKHDKIACPKCGSKAVRPV